MTTDIAQGLVDVNVRPSMDSVMALARTYATDGENCTLFELKQALKNKHF